MKKIVKHLLAVVFVLLLAGKLPAQQERYWVFLRDKQGVSFNPIAYFDAKAIARRIKHNIPLSDSSDFPLNQNYIAQIRKLGVQTRTQSRWFNAVAVSANSQQIARIESLPFVKKTQPIVFSTRVAQSHFNTHLNEQEEKLLMNQTRRMQGNLFVEDGMNGAGVRIAIFDAGFPSVEKNPVFEHIRREGRIIKTWDFVQDEEDVYAHHSHGTMVLSCTGGMIDGKKTGLATGAEYLLARTEMWREPSAEEEYWLAAVEWADKNGADIINSSLGYTHRRYFADDMDGKTSLISRAANKAASKGMLVVNAMGNDGNKDWKVLGTPADADSVLSVGAIDPKTDLHSDFSSFGPTFDQRRKPNVCAYGDAIVAGTLSLKQASGTSFASPLVAGFAACAWQKYPEMTNMQIFREIEKSADLYPYYDYAHGYGVPQAGHFVFNNLTRQNTEPTFELKETDEKILIKAKKEFIGDLSDAFKPGDYLYYHIEGKNGVLIKYLVIKVLRSDVAKINLRDREQGQVLRVFFKGYVQSYTF